MTKVLIVEDDAILLENISLDLEMRGYEVIAVTNGAEALNDLKNDTPLPDVIVSDIAMPEVDGFQLLHAIRNTPTWTQIPVLFLTAFNSEDTKQNADELGADGYIIKPFDMDELVEKIENTLQ